MLTALAIANYRSFHQPQVLDLSDEGQPQRSHLLCGANGSGKTNAIQALKQLRDALLDTPEQPRKRPLAPFAFQPERHPSCLEVTLLLEGVRYRYRLAIAGELVVEESLIAYPNQRPRRLFARSRAADGSGTWVLHPCLGRTRAQMRKQLPDTALFLGRAGALGLSALQPVYRWFRERLLILEEQASALPRFTLKMLAQPLREQHILSFLKRFYPTLDHLQVCLSPPVQVHPGSLLVRKDPELSCVYRHASGSLSVPYAEETGGMRRLLTLAGPLCYALERGITLVVDGLDDQLHPSQAEYLLRQFQDAASGGGQLLFSAQPPRAMAPEGFAVNQIHLFERNADMATRITRFDSLGARTRRALNRAQLIARPHRPLRAVATV